MYIGLRDVEQGEKDLLKKHNIKAFSMHQVDKYGIGSVMEQSIAYLNEGSPDGKPVPIHLTFDVDALDPSVAPGIEALHKSLSNIAFYSHGDSC